MRASKMLYCCVLALLAAPLAAQSRPDLSTPRSGLPAELLAPADSLIGEARESRPLFFALTPEQAAGTPGFLEFRVTLNGQPFLEETLSLEKAWTAKAPAFELLASRPDLRDRLYDLGRGRSKKIALQVLLDHVEIGRFSSFGEFLQYNRQLKSRSLTPVPAVSELRDLSGRETPPTSGLLDQILAKGLQKDPACVDACWAEYDDCVNNNGCDYGDCSRCQSYYDSCYYYCPTICVDPKSVKDTQKSQVVGVVGGGYECLENIWENDFQEGEWYQLLQVTYKSYTERRTEYCNGTVTIEEINVTYPTVYCYNRSFGVCFYPWTWAYNIC